MCTNQCGWQVCVAVTPSQTTTRRIRYGDSSRREPDAPSPLLFLCLVVSGGEVCSLPEAEVTGRVKHKTGIKSDHAPRCRAAGGSA